MSGEGNAKKPSGYVYTIVDRPGKKSLWYRIGAVWTNKDLSLNGTLAALPVNGRIHIRSPSADGGDDLPEGAEAGGVDDDIPY